MWHVCYRFVPDLPQCQTFDYCIDIESPLLTLGEIMDAIAGFKAQVESGRYQSERFRKETTCDYTVEIVSIFPV